MSRSTWWTTTSSNRASGSSRAGTCSPPRSSTTASQAPASSSGLECVAQPAGRGVQVDLQLKTRPAGALLDLGRPLLCRGVHVLAFAGTRPLGQPDQPVGLAGDVGRHVTPTPVRQPARRPPVFVADRDGVAEQPLRRGGDQPAQRFQLRRAGRPGARQRVLRLRARAPLVLSQRREAPVASARATSATVRRAACRVDAVHTHADRDRPARRARGPRAQPAQHLARPAARCPDRLHRPVRLRQVEPGLRHHLRRGPAALRGVAVGVRAAVPGADGQAGRRLHRGPVAGGLDRPEVDQPQPALDGGHHHRGVRLPAAAVRAGRTAALPGLR